jgi:hypothetical protein
MGQTVRFTDFFHLGEVHYLHDLGVDSIPSVSSDLTESARVNHYQIHSVSNRAKTQYSVR